MTRETEATRVTGAANEAQRLGAELLPSLKPLLAGCGLALTLAGAACAGEQNLLFYNARTGSAGIARLQGDEIDTVKSYPSGAFSSKWTHATAFGNTVLFYDSARGAGAEGQLDGGDFVTTQTWTNGSFGKWTSIAPAGWFKGPLFYNAADGSGGIGYAPPGRQYPAGAFARGWTHIASTDSALLFYNSNNGAGGIAIPIDSSPPSPGSFGSLNDLKTVAVYKPGSFSTGWTHMVSTPAGILFYNRFDGSAGVGRVVMGPGSDQASFQTDLSYRPGSFSTGWTHVMAAGSKIVFYNSANGAGGVGEIVNGAFKTTKSYAPGAFSLGWTHLVVAADHTVIH